MRKVIAVSIILVGIDLIIKGLIMNLMYYQQKITVIPNFFSLWYVRNDGAAFSILSGQQFFLISIAIMVLVYLVYLIKVEEKISKFMLVIYSMLIAGITSNLIDRVLFGEVVDYLAFNFGNYAFPVFNLADTMIVLAFVGYIGEWIYRSIKHGKIN